ncbi:LeoA/HP0731 family dynamin-like GTPase [Salisediminibacterium selenitireducens]|uniref:Labile enterotoxin output A n=1 Tax=Bacillus selenitireducens (strain ATCC 700615 / DSM 15326 / MLS10) TaxID=439292 RepID=D6XVY4_BACIE|nr:LeoA/HP0731 family dynamin-like GTPase [Salisediminibacterium selenitireducens]ADH97757.1 labile enterotoxin output A [[Bacillus] selenitireducens MLS10]
METIDYFKQRQSKTIEVLKRLMGFLEDGERFGITLDQSVINKIQSAINTVETDILKVALIGGFSEGKTSIAAAWSEKYDTSSMIISQSESTDNVNIYKLDDFELIDTPGLFGFKETEDRQRFNDLTKKYVSEANLIIYVMNPNNPIKESHKEDLTWLFKDLNLLPRTVFVISRFDEEADLEDEDDFNERFYTKRENILSRLNDFGIIQKNEEISVVAVSANPFGEGIDHWLSNLNEYKKISRISQLQEATTEKIKSVGGEHSFVVETQMSILRDVIKREMPTAMERVVQASKEVEKLRNTFIDIQKELNKSEKKISDARIDLRTNISSHFKDLILQVKGTDLNTIDDFFERNIGDEGIVLETDIQNEFDRQLGKITHEISQAEKSLKSSVGHYNNIVGDMALDGMKLGGEFLKKGGFQLNKEAVLATRDLLAPSIKFKPWGAFKLAKNLNKGAAVFGAVLGLGLEVWESWSKRKKEQEFQKLIEKTVQHLSDQRKEYLAFVNNDEFEHTFFPQYIQLLNDIEQIKTEVSNRETIQKEFEKWQHQGEIIEAEYKLLP